MEPLSTLALVAAFLAPVPLTRRPDWSVQKPIVHDHALIDGLSTTDIQLGVLAETAITLPVMPSKYLDLGEALKEQIRLYTQQTDGWDGSGSIAPSQQSALAATVFLDSVPGGFPLPTPMLSRKGEVGFYWDFELGYADVSFAPDGMGSFFSRSTDGAESFSENISSQQFTRDWFFDAIGALSSPVAIAA